MPETKWDPVKYNQIADFVAKLGEPLITLLAPKSSDLLLDIGCGDGKLTQKLQGVCQHIIGIDSSSDMVKAANSLGIEAYLKDAHQLEFDAAFDGIISNAALHWMTSPEKVLKGVHDALRPKGIFVAEFGGLGNAGKIVNAVSTALLQRDIPFQNPWYFPSTEAYSTLLKESGFKVESIELFDRLTPLPEHLSEWILTFGQSFFSNASDQQIDSIIGQVINQLKPDLFINGHWHVDYVRLRVRAAKL